MVRLFGLLFLLCGTVLASDPHLEAPRSTLLPMRSIRPEDANGQRGATPQLTVAKHQLRDWLDFRLAQLSENADTSETQRSLNLELRDAELSCTDDAPVKTKCPEGTLSGFAGPVTVRWSMPFLVVTSGVGIECGYDESAYVYGWNGEKWGRVWQNEQNIYTEDKYKPQTLHGVLISEYNRGNDYLVLTLGSESWCSSNWHDVYYRVFRLGPDPKAEPLVDGSEWTGVGLRYPPIVGSISDNDVMIEYLGRTIDNGRMVRERVFHYEIQHGEAKRTDPLALGPRDFVDEWLKTDWRESSQWSEDANRRLMLEWRRKFDKVDKGDLAGEFIDPTLHCRTKSDLWQVGVNLTPDSEGAKPKTNLAYFLVRWRPPYEFRMVEVRDKPSPDCTEKDPRADDHRLLFPIQDWR